VRTPFNISRYAVIAFLTGCAASGPIFSPHQGIQADQALLYVFRPDAHAMSVLAAEIEVDGKVQAQLENNGYVALPLAAGRYVVVQRWKAGLLGEKGLENRPISSTVDLAAGSVTYLRLGTQAAVDGPTAGKLVTQFRWELRKVSEADAAQEVAKCRRANVRAQAKLELLNWTAKTGTKKGTRTVPIAHPFPTSPELEHEV
jgi:hypothetical protein